MSFFTRLYRFLSSRSVALILLSLLAAVAILGGLISQLTRAGLALPRALSSLSLNDLFQARWLLVIAAALVVNLLLCSMARMRLRLREPGQIPGLLHFRQIVTSIPVAESATIIREELLDRKFQIRRQVRLGRTLIASRRNRLSLFGSILFHLAFIVAFAGFLVRSRKAVEGEFELFPEQTQALVAPWGDTLNVQMVDFGASYSIGPGLENYILRQRQANLVFYRNDRFVRATGMAISRPATFDGFRFFPADPLQVFVLRAESRRVSGGGGRGSASAPDTVVRVRENEQFRIDGAGTFAIGTARLGQIYARDSVIARLPMQAPLYRIREGGSREPVDTLRVGQPRAVDARTLNLLNIRQGLRVLYRFDPGLPWFYAAGALFLLGILLRALLPGYELSASITDEEGETVVRLGGRALGLFTSLRPIVNGIADRFGQ
jgi:hypothetical protein